MRITRLLTLFAGALLAMVSVAGTATAVPAAATSASAPATKAAAAATGYAAPTMVHCKLNVRSGTSSTSTLLRTLYNRNGSCPGDSGHDSIPCWIDDCGGTISGSSYTCQSGGRSYSSWLPVNHRGSRAWVAIKCGTTFGP